MTQNSGETLTFQHATEAQRRQPLKEFLGPLSGRVYFEKRRGLRWEVWFSYLDGTCDSNRTGTWKASSVRYWRRINAARAANDLWASFNAGVWCESGRMSCDGRTPEPAPVPPSPQRRRKNDETTLHH